ncbi:hypothetical protein SNK03_13599 [Fusarium graminearum]|uniref:Chromosome 2, complete genome n=1 Tax=Gibberella zeae (strain ATCC MYA-4620 / CBS 123657 / FGSC 9075 / NRRL 31084 / PH-1) TaxID=229533 RepID=I1S6M7_GIBZE|nr:hypothetical protein FGSG_12499 [Fusarium graminearum PH-1]ESU10099.1 hypothetical protein FGSG_12499 [Fusarium graminearum PH-1]CEF77912.1 unnamed protein product [Fusarium graminearum]CZS81209.1 unnamed protein product [Fusarium graminearum]|eukprot:XP_011322598.1 hypothetical protein FGSG_12499 [Fusarium graminearum PH-1]
MDRFSWGYARHHFYLIWICQWLAECFQHRPVINKRQMTAFQNSTIPTITEGYGPEYDLIRPVNMLFSGERVCHGTALTPAILGKGPISSPETSEKSPFFGPSRDYQAET